MTSLLWTWVAESKRQGKQEADHSMKCRRGTDDPPPQRRLQTPFPTGATEDRTKLITSRPNLRHSGAGPSSVLHDVNSGVTTVVRQPKTETGAEHPTSNPLPNARRACVGHVHPYVTLPIVAARRAGGRATRARCPQQAATAQPNPPSRYRPVPPARRARSTQYKDSPNGFSLEGNRCEKRMLLFGDESGRVRSARPLLFPERLCSGTSLACSALRPTRRGRKYKRLAATRRRA
ncbi:hypothetical protein BD309DRAFT_380695 [Dichomitus squalens]|nr:hypothetical protein BD309DRAFT_380695 [Dichomitus squalens]